MFCILGLCAILEWCYIAGPKVQLHVLEPSEGRMINLGLDLHDWLDTDFPSSHRTEQQQRLNQNKLCFWAQQVELDLKDQAPQSMLPVESRPHNSPSRTTA